MAEVDLWGCPSCGTSVRGTAGFCTCGHFLGVEIPTLQKEWRDVGVSLVVDAIERRRFERDVEVNRRVLGLPPLLRSS